MTDQLQNQSYPHMHILQARREMDEFYTLWNHIYLNKTE